MTILDWSANVINTESLVSLVVLSTFPPPFLLFSRGGQRSFSTSRSGVIPDTTMQRPAWVVQLSLSSACELDLFSVTVLPSTRIVVTTDRFNNFSATVHNAQHTHTHTLISAITFKISLWEKYWPMIWIRSLARSRVGQWLCFVHVTSLFCPTLLLSLRTAKNYLKGSNALLMKAGNLLTTGNVSYSRKSTSYEENKLSTTSSKLQRTTQCLISKACQLLQNCRNNPIWKGLQ